LHLAALVAMSRHLSCGDGGLCVALRWGTPGMGRGFRAMDRYEIHDSTGFLWHAVGGVIPTLDGALGYNREGDDVRLRLFLFAKGMMPREQFANGCNMQCPAANCKPQFMAAKL